MFARLRSTALFALYQLTIVAGILLLPVGMLARQVGLPFPFHRAIRWFDTHDQTQTQT